MNSIMTTQNLCIGYGKKKVLENINIEIERGCITTVIGPNGSGKSTLLKTISGIIPALGGEVIYEDRSLSKWGDADLARKISVMMTSVNDTEYMDCREVVALGRYPYTGRLGILTDEDERIIDEAMESVGVGELADTDFSKLSDGQRQRVLLARAICQKPHILIMDEPTTYLDISYKLELLASLKKLVGQGLTVLMSVHDLEIARRISDRVVCVDKDRCVMARPEEVFVDEYLLELYKVDKKHFDDIYKGDRLI